MSYDLDTLCLELAAKRAEGFLKDKLLFLNTDPSVISTDYFREIKFLQGVSLPPSQICVEITERTYISNFARFNDNLNKVKPLGVMIVIDDLGEGYSSLKAIAEFKPSYIKIDMGLVRNIHKDEVKQSICQVIVDLSAKIGSKVIAEGVETEEEYKALQSLKVEFGQGFLFGKPAERA
jgi:EAL domain-containing protein (putative c-di-GMP-specific phosphodiesterase class I)